MASVVAKLALVLDATDDVDATLPLVDRLRTLAAEGPGMRVTVALPPAAGARLRDPRQQRRIDERLAGSPLQVAWRAMAQDVVGALADLEAAGRVEILGGAATPAPLPLLAGAPRSVRAQVAVGCAEHARLFGHRPRGLRLPGDAWSPDLDGVLADEGVGFVVLDEHGVRDAVPRPLAGVHAPIVTSAGVIAVAGERALSDAIASSSVAAIPEILSGLVERGRILAARLGAAPLFVAAPSLGANGIEIVERLLRAAAGVADELELVTLGGVLEGRSFLQRATPVASARPAAGGTRWVDGAHAWALRHVHHASRTMTTLARAKPDARGLPRRALTQAARELLLLEGDAGALLAGTGDDAAVSRFRLHLDRFRVLAANLRAESIDERWLVDVEGRDDGFEGLDYRVYC